MRTLPKVSPSMLDALLWFYEHGNWDHVRTGTSVALLDRKLVAHERRGQSPSLITDDGVAVLLAHGRLVHKVDDTVRSRATDEVGTVTEVHSTYIVTTIGTGGVAAYLPVSQLPAVRTETSSVELAEVVPDAAEVTEAPQRELSDLERLYTDHVLVKLMTQMPGENVRRRRAELLLQLPAEADRVAAVAQAADASKTVGGPDLAVALAEILVKHPNWRPVSCGGRYLPCQFDDGSTDYGVWDTEAEAWVEIGAAGITRWSSFQYANADAVSMSALSGQGVAQKPYAMSVVRPGDQIEGQDVTFGSRKRGHVVQVSGPIKSPDCGGYRYHIRAEDGRRHVVFAERWI